MQGADELLDWVKRTGLKNIVWTTDLDKSVLDVSSNPEKMAPAPGLEEACARLEAQTAGFYVITGRDANYVDNVVFPNSQVRLSAEYHNMIRYEPGGEMKELSARPQWSLIDPEMDELVAGTEGLQMRKKPFMRSLHYSQVPEDKRPAVKEMLRGALTSLLAKFSKATGQEIELTDGGPIFDMGPKGQDKGVALNDIMVHATQEHGGAALVPIYFGDSPGDIPAGKAVQAHGGVFVCVGGDARVLAVADFALKDPTECRALFKKVTGMTNAPVPLPSPQI